MINILLVLLLVILLFFFVGIKTKQHFQVTNKLVFEYIGCFKDKTTERALSKIVGEVDSPESCALEAQKQGSRFFGLQNVLGEKDGLLLNKPICFISNQIDKYDKHGESEDCITVDKNTYGKKGVNAVYKVLNKGEIEERERLKKRLSKNALLLNNGKDVLDSCSFDPTKIPNGFETKLACKDYCRNNDNNSKFGGSLCAENICEAACENCTDTNFCRWNTVPVIDEEKKIPEPIELEYKIDGSLVKLLWEKPFSINEISHYNIVITQQGNPDKLEVEVNDDIKSDFVVHIVRNLNPSNVYYIEVYTRNSNGYSKASNKIQVQTEYTTEEGYRSQEPAYTGEDNQQKIQEFQTKLRRYIASNREKEGEIDVSSPLSILTQDKERDKLRKENYNIDVFFN